MHSIDIAVWKIIVFVVVGSALLSHPIFVSLLINDSHPTSDTPTKPQTLLPRHEMGSGQDAFVPDTSG